MDDPYKEAVYLTYKDTLAQLRGENLHLRQLLDEAGVDVPDDDYMARFRKARNLIFAADALVSHMGSEKELLHPFMTTKEK